MKAKIFGVLTLSLGVVLGQGPYVPNPNVTRVPVYHFQAGQELTYHGHSSLAVGARVVTTDLVTTIWVTGQNQDGSWHLVVRRTRASYAVDSAGTRTDEPATAVWAVWDLRSSGHANYNRTMEELDPNALFIPLPEDILAANAEWSFARRNYWEQNKYALDERSTDSIWIVKDSFLDPLVQVGRMSLSAELQIDARQGLPVRRDESFIQYYTGSSSETRTLTVLEPIRTLDTTWLQTLAADARIYFETDSVYNELLEQAIKKPKKTKDLLALSKIALQRCRSRIGTREFQDQLDTELAGFVEDSTYIQKESAQMAAFIDQPARGWETEDFNGKPYALKGLRKKVIIMDFWYRGCPWCIMAMPQLKGLAEYFAGRAVVVLGMNKDKDEADARFVIENMKLDYPNLKASAIAEDYGIKAYPFLLVIDQKGIIRDVHIGYSPGLFDALRERVEGLLK